MTALQSTTLAKIRAHVSGFDQLPNGEKVLQCMAYLADFVHVREELGNNHGKFVDDFLHEAGGLSSGYPWCAASINWCCEMCATPNPDVSDAAVIGWVNWAKRTGRLLKGPKRGCACALLHGSTGHIGIVISSDGEDVRSIEGNTSPGTEGSQRDGDGLYRRVRDIGHWDYFISLD